jgi:ABC-type nitrate/sulfonate/bicarbonate transport system substrate-binding protein
MPRIAAAGCLRACPAIALSALTALLSVSCGRRAPTPASRDGSPETSARLPTLAASLQTPSALAILAWKGGRLERNGARFRVREYVSGSRALAALLDGEADFATTADVPIAFGAFGRSDFRVLACIGTTGNEGQIVARADRGIRAPADLRGKLIGTQKASAVHFFLHSFLTKHGISERDVSVRFYKAEELPAALEKGEIAALSMREPYAGDAVARLGTNAVVFQEPGLYFRHEVLVVRADSLAADRPAAVALLRALGDAARWARERPGDAIGMVSAALGVPEAGTRRLWADLDLRLSLDQALLSALEDAARWGLRGGLVEGTRPPNFLPLIDWGPLEAVDPEAITLIR